MPGNSLPLAVGVGGEDDAVAGGCVGTQLTDQRRLAWDIHVAGLETVLDIHPQQRLGQVPDMAHGGHHLVAWPQIFFDGLRLGGRFHDHQF